MLTKRAAEAIAGTLGYPSKMPGTSYGIPAQACLTGAKLAQIEGSVCHGCYAMRGNYIFRDVKKAQATRLAGITSPDWVEAMVTLLTAVHSKGINPKTKQPLDKVHRWHDSGDLQSRDHLAKICAVARATPWLRHWLPTREGMLLKGFVRDGGTIPDNLVIRLSATMVDGATPTAWPQTSTVHDKRTAQGETCGAPTRGNKCGPCRLCWDAAVANVSYHIH